MSRRLCWAGICGALIALVGFTAVAGRYDDARAQAQASMVVTGSIDIGQDGGVLSYRVDRPDLLPEAVKAHAAKAIPQWRFEPVIIDGQAVHARTRMSVRFVARHEEGDKYLLRISGATFGDSNEKPDAEDAQPSENIAEKSMKPPLYPRGMLRAGIEGMVYVVLRVGLDGKVENAAVEQVNLRTVGSERVMEQAREQFADASLAAARKWTFTLPQAGKAAAQLDRDIRVPITYFFEDTQLPGYGQWDVYIPGPRHVVPWLPMEEQQGSDALIAGGIYPIGAGPRLLTPLGGEAG